MATDESHGVKSSADDIINELVSSMASTVDKEGEEETADDSSAIEEQESDEEEIKDKVKKSKKSKKEKKHKRRKKKKSKHKGSSRSSSRERHKRHKRSRSHSDERQRKRRLSDLGEDVVHKDPNPKRVQRPLSPPIVIRHHSRDKDYSSHRDHWGGDDDRREVSRRVQPPPGDDHWRHHDSRSPSRHRSRHNHHHRQHDSRERSVSPYDHRHRSHRDQKRERRDGHEHEPRGSKGSRDRNDPFWESTWEAIEEQKKAEEKERKGRHYLEPEKRKRPVEPMTRASDSERESSPETAEAKTLQRLKEISELVVKDSEKFVAEPPNPDLFEWDERTKMRRKKIPPVAEKVKETSGSDKAEEKINTRALTLDEIEEIRKKREKNKQKEKEKEEGEIGSDEEDRIDRKERNSNRRSSSRRYSRSPQRDRHYRDNQNSYGHGRQNYRYRQRSRSRDRQRGRYSRSRSRDRRGRSDFRGSRSAIDKAKLLAIAQKNAVKLLNSNDLKGMDKSRLVAIKSGGQNLAELTMFCRELAKRGITDEFSDDNHSGSDSDSRERNINHPFMVRDRPLPNPIMLSMTGLKSSLGPANGLTLATMTPAMRDAARSHRLMEFPVSSGNAHRVKEVDLIEDDAAPIPTGIKAAQNAVVSLANTNDPVLKMLKLDTVEPAANKLPPLPDQLIARKIPAEGEEVSSSPPPPLTEAQKVNMANPLGVIMFGGQVEKPLALPAPDPKPEEDEATLAALALSDDIPPPPKPSTSEPVFKPAPQPKKDIGDIISIRLNAMKRLSSNPEDPEALKLLYDAQQEMSTWAESKNKPGQFTGHTGAKILSKGELMTGIQAWARNEQFTKAQKVSGGFGEYMLRKMGWRQGEGLGKDRSGEVDPLQLDIKFDKKGLISAEEAVTTAKKNNRNEVLTLTGLKDLSGKHPVTAIMEVATRRKWGAPNFTQIFECGPPHKKQYIWKCTLNGIDYQPTIAADNKKKAKANAATVALQELGMLPKDPNNPL